MIQADVDGSPRRSGSPRCAHCQSEVPPERRPPSHAEARAVFCCAGCETVYRLLHDERLGRYYELAGNDLAPVGANAQAASLSWLDPLLERALSTRAGETCALELDVQGIRCAACVWLLSELGRRRAASVTVNPALGKARLLWKAGGFDPAAWVKEASQFGYRFGPPTKRSERSFDALALRLGVTTALTVNVMLFSLSFYLGLTPAEGQLFSLFSRLSLLLSTAAVVIGGWPFFVSAAQGLRRGLLHLDLPIALGIVLVYATSVWQAREGRGDLAYFDTLNTFITLMLAGRWLQQRVLERNRRYLLEETGVEHLSMRREVDGKLTSVPAGELAPGDVIWLAPGELLPVDGELLDEMAHFSTDWLTGESTPQSVSRGGRVLAGSTHCGRTAVRVRAQNAFSGSSLAPRVRSPAPGSTSSKAQHPLTFWGRIARRWVLSVLALTALALALWWPSGPSEALRVAAALLVVTCPCAIGIALPLAYELTQSRLRRNGFFIRDDELLDRLLSVRHVLFDKTGTLTAGRLQVSISSGLDDEARDVAYNLAARSAHPVSEAIAQALGAAGARFVTEAAVEEEPGMGMRWLRGDGEWRLGRASWTTGDLTARGTVLSLQGHPVAAFVATEVPRPDAASEVRALGRAGFSLWLLSGDTPSRASALAERVGIPEAQAFGGLSPEDKAEKVRGIDRHDTLYVGDGVNDALAFQAAWCAGTPAVDRPIVPSRSSFFIVGDGLATLREALQRAAELRRVVRWVLTFATLYNVGTVGLSLAGWMTPLKAAIAMPVSSILITAFTAYRLAGARSPRMLKAPLPSAVAPEVAAS